MTKKYYIDTSIWIDLYEDRRGYNDEPLGSYALRLFTLIKSKRQVLVLTDLLIHELEINYSIEEIKGMVKPFEELIKIIIVTAEQRDEAKKIAEERNLPAGDVLHSIIARDNRLILVTRDNHFKKCQKPPVKDWWNDYEGYSYHWWFLSMLRIPHIS